MSQAYPAPVINSEEEPSEYNPDSDNMSVNDNRLTETQTSPENSSSNTLPAVPSAMPQAASNSVRPRNLPTETTNDLPIEPPPKRFKNTHLAWMPNILRHWRIIGGIPSTFEFGESSRSPQINPITEEPLELTVPTLVAMADTHERNLHSIHTEILELQSDTSVLEGDVISIYKNLEEIENHTTADRETTQTTLARVEALEERARAAEVVARICMLMTGAMAVVGMYLNYHH